MAGVFGKRSNQPQPVQHVIGKEHFGFLKALGIAPDGPENVIPSRNDIDERLAKGRADLDRRIEVLHKNLAAEIGPEIRMRPFWLIAESCWQGTTGAFLLKFLDFNPYDNWNIAFLPADQLSSLIMDAPLHPDAEIPAFAAAGKELIAECDSRVAQATMKAGQTGEFQLVTAARTDAQSRIVALALTFAAKLLEAHDATKSRSRLGPCNSRTATMPQATGTLAEQNEFPSGTPTDINAILLRVALIGKAISTILNGLQTPEPTLDRKLEEEAIARIEPLNRELERLLEAKRRLEDKKR